MLHGKPLMDDATLKDFRGGEGARVANALERSFLLPVDMAELRGMRRQEVAHNLKRYLGMAIQAAFRLDEEADNQGKALDQERHKYLTAASTLKRSEADLKKAVESLEEMTRARDKAASDLVAQGGIADLKKELAEAVAARGIAEYVRDKAVRAKEEAVFAREDAEHSVEQAEEEAFAEGVAKTEAALKAQIPEVCRRFCSETWEEALNQAGVEASSDLRRAERVYYPCAIREFASIVPEAGSALQATDKGQTDAAEDSTSTDKPVEGAERYGALDGAGAGSQEVPQDVVKPLADSQATLVGPQIPPAEEGFSEVAPPSQSPEVLVEALQQTPQDKLSTELEE
nr:uncharacterized protein LOC111992371 [Quercus suber]